VNARDIAGLFDTDPTAAVEALRTILEADDIRALINPEVVALLISADSQLKASAARPVL
jgi:hypothetical protein